MAATRPPDTKLRLGFWWRFLGAAAVVYGLYTVWLGGAYRSLEPFVAGECLAVEAPAGPEDIVLLPGQALAIVSAQDRRRRSEPGALWLYDFSARPGRFTKLEPPPGLPFHPHGMSLFEAADGQVTLQVINHRDDRLHSVEFFTLEDRRLKHQGSVKSDLFISPNALAATGPDSFYLTNDRGTGPRWMHGVENLLQLARSTVVYFDGRTARLAAEDIAFANGVALSSEGDALVVGSTLWRMLLAYQRDPVGGLLKRTGSLALPGGVDNIQRDGRGDLWAALHVNAFAFIGHARDAEKESPSQIVRIARDERGATRVQQAFADPGSLLSGASVAAHRDGRLLIGAVFQPRLLDCRIDPAKLRDVD